MRLLSIDDTHHPSPAPAASEETYGSNAVRLTAGQWAVALAILGTIYFGMPRLWLYLESFEPGPDYRVPYAMSNDYWHYSRYARIASQEAQVLVLGDSVIWGQYVAPDETLSHYLNEQTGSARFANLGINGIHPVAMAGLIKHYTRALTHEKVLIHYNPLWMTSRRRDLQDAAATRFNHPKLAPQFFPSIPSYKASYGERLAVAIARNSLFLGWTAHLRSAYFDEEDLPAWTLEHPYKNPLNAVVAQSPAARADRMDAPEPLTQQGIEEQSFPWLKPEESLQWAFFKRSLEILRHRGNRVFVIVGPFNEHMLRDENRVVYAGILGDIEAWLEQNHFPHVVLALLPRELYADASHPIKEGYAILARQLLAQPDFQAFLAE